MSESAAVKRSSKIDEILNSSVRARSQQSTKQRTEESEFSSIQSNPFYSAIFNESLSPEQKTETVAKILTFEGTKEENRERIKAFETFKEYLQAHREKMATEIINLTSTDTFAELKQVYEDLNGGLLDFDEKMKPLTEIIDAVYKLRTNGVALEAFKEIQEDRQSAERIQAEKDAILKEIDQISNNLASLDIEVNSLSKKRSFFGFGGITDEAQLSIANKKLEIESNQTKLTELQNKIIALESGASNPSELGEFSAEKEKLRELLDITSEEHKERQRGLVDSALNFVKTSKERVGSVRDHLSKMNDQVENLSDSNGQMAQVYAILNEGIKGAEKHNQDERQKLMEAPEDENTILKLQREQKKMDIESHMTALDSSAADTVTTFGDLTSQAIRIKTMKDANDGQIAKARNMHTQGVAGIADRLSVVLQAVSGAALGESSSMAQDTLAKMAESTNTISQKESIRIAMGISDQNSQLEKAIEDLAAYGEIAKTATNITREGVAEMRDKLAEMENIAKDVRENIAESIAVNAEVGLGVNKTSEKKDTKAANPFKI